MKILKAFIIVFFFIPSVSHADCVSQLMGLGVPPGQAEAICTSEGTKSAEQITSTDDATITDDLAVGGAATVTGASTLTGNVAVGGTLTGTGASLGWTYETGANTACTTTCGAAAAVFGVDLAGGATAPVIVGPTSADADACVCAGAAS